MELEELEVEFQDVLSQANNHVDRERALMAKMLQDLLDAMREEDEAKKR